MAKGQKRSNRETRKPKQAKTKAGPAPRSFLAAPSGSLGKSSARPKVGG